MASGTDSNVIKYVFFCFTCLIVCLFLGKLGSYPNMKLVTFKTKDYSFSQFEYIGNQMVQILKNAKLFGNTLGKKSSISKDSRGRKSIQVKSNPSTAHTKTIKKLPDRVSKSGPEASNVRPSNSGGTLKSEIEPKIILWFNKPRFIKYLPKLIDLPNCTWKCQETTNLLYYNQSAAILFIAQTMRMSPPKRMNSDQVFVLHNHEAPTNGWRFRPSFRKPEWKSQFNWTMFYRQDSDIVYRYGLIKKRQTEVQKNYADILKTKTKMVAWMVSHCKTNSRREKYVEELKKYVNIDIYGICGKRCPRNSETRCRKIISNEYKFYLSFENALCEDYVTEKFFRQFNENVITVVRGGKKYSQIAPKGLYINTADFKSPKALAEYLLGIDKNNTAYEYMLRQKDKYEAVFEKYELKSGGHVLYTNYHYKMAAMCQLCERLWNLDKYRKHYDDINTWFDYGPKACMKPDDI